MTARQHLIKDVLGLKAADKTMESGAKDELYLPLSNHNPLKEFFSIHVIKGHFYHSLYSKSKQFMNLIMRSELSCAFKKKQKTKTYIYIIML